MQMCRVAESRQQEDPRGADTFLVGSDTCFICSCGEQSQEHDLDRGAVTDDHMEPNDPGPLRACPVCLLSSHAVCAGKLREFMQPRDNDPPCKVPPPQRVPFVVGTRDRPVMIAHEWRSGRLVGPLVGWLSCVSVCMCLCVCVCLSVCLYVWSLAIISFLRTLLPVTANAAPSCVWATTRRRAGLCPMPCHVSCTVCMTSFIRLSPHAAHVIVQVTASYIQFHKS